MPIPLNPKLSAEAVFNIDGFNKKVTASLRKNKGHVANAAADLGVSSRTLFRYIGRSKDLRKALKEARTP